MKTLVAICVCAGSLWTVQAQEHDFVIGMIGFHPMYQNIPCHSKVPVTSKHFLDTNGNEKNTSILNVLSEDGFNVALGYSYPSTVRHQIHVESALKLFEANGMKFHLGGMGGSFYKSDERNCNYSGVAIFDGETDPARGKSNINACDENRRPNLDLLFQTTFNNPVYANNIWGYHVTEEPELYNAVNPTSTYHFDPHSEFYNREVEATVIEEAIIHFREKKLPQHKLIQMHASHGKSITEFVLHDAEGPQTPRDFMELENRCDVFLEGSYLDFVSPTTDWSKKNYSDIFNIGYNDESHEDACTEGKPRPITWSQTNYALNNKHYLGFLESLNYGRSLFSEVHKVVGSKVNTGGGVGIYSSSESVLNWNWLWFQSYSSIIHGANGIWFFSLASMFQKEGEEQKKWKAMDKGAFEVAAYERENFPEAYNDYISPLARELDYLANFNFLDVTDADVEVAQKLNEPDKYFIVEDISQHDFFHNGVAIDLDAEHSTENYNLRYTIRTNGDEVIMIIANVLPFTLKANLNFESLNNSIVQNAEEVFLLFEAQNPEVYFNGKSRDGFVPMNYKVVRNSVNANGQISVEPFSFDFTNKSIDLTFGPLDVHVLKF